MDARNVHLGVRIKELRKRAGFSQEDLAESVGIDGKYVSRIEVGKRSPSLETLFHIADALAVDVHELFDFSHHDAEEVSPKGIEKYIKGANKEQLQLIYKLVRAVRY